MYPQKGSLLPGSDADIVIWHPRGAMEPFDLTNDRLHHNVDCASAPHCPPIEDADVDRVCVRRHAVRGPALHQLAASVPFSSLISSLTRC